MNINIFDGNWYFSFYRIVETTRQVLNAIVAPKVITGIQNSVVVSLARVRTRIKDSQALASFDRTMNPFVIANLVTILKLQF